jgi:hypothetical protein
MSAYETQLVYLIEEKYKVKYIGYYDIPGRDSVRIFYQSNPRLDLGHSNYLGVILQYRGTDLDIPPEIWLCDGKTILEAKYPAIRFEDGTILCSRYRHDYVTQPNQPGVFLDGGLDYTRCNPKHRPNGHIVIVDDHEEFVPLQVESNEVEVKLEITTVETDEVKKIQIETGVPIPHRTKGRPSPYPLADMLVGDSIFVPGIKEGLAARCAAHNLRRGAASRRTWRFTTQSIDVRECATGEQVLLGMRIWRTA